MRSAFAILEERFGVISDVKPHHGMPDYQFVAIGGGSPEFWSSHEAAVRYSFSVHFSKWGPGWLFVEMNDACKAPRVKAILYALPTEKTGSDELVRKVLGELAASVQRIQDKK